MVVSNAHENFGFLHISFYKIVQIVLPIIEVIGMAAIFTYGFPEATRRFEEANVKLITLSNYNAMLEAAVETNYSAPEYLETLQEWRKDPANWLVEK